jgi:hypothetical protein
VRTRTGDQYVVNKMLALLPGAERIDGYNSPPVARLDDQES